MTTPQDLTRLILAILFLGGLIGLSLWILLPFLPAIVWAATLVIATWPLFRRLEARLLGRRSLAVAAMTLMLLVLVVVPVWRAIDIIVKNAGTIVSWGEYVAVMEFPPAPAWLAGLPMVGESAAEAWNSVGSSGWRELLQLARPYAGQATQWFVGAAGSFGLMLVQLLLTIAVAVILYAQGEQAAALCVRFGGRLAGERGRQSAILAAQAIRGVALGVVVTALVQSAVGGIGLFVAGVPFAGVLGAVMFFLCLAQLGPALVLVPAVIWMYASGSATLATVLLVFAVVAMTMDNFLRPVLIRMGADLPLLLILAGVIGGLVAFGLIGIFLGPTILAVGYTLLRAWIAEDGVDDGDGEPGDAG
ncbi:MAG: AI-2E family transporter YdiK [Rhodospirillales bacterium]|nr:AI-2E family transporter YdiK [Rhodospirillales bacterium]